MQTACLAALLWHLPASASDEWLPVRETTLAVEAGSPLDFSGILANQPIDGANNRLISGDGGHTATAALPARPKRFHCASLGWSPASGGFPDHPTADLYARQLAMRGYNMARFHFLDASLMEGRQRDFDFDPETLDRAHYLMAALKRNGIYWMLDGLSSWQGASGGADGRWDPKTGLKLELNYDDGAFRHWRRLVTTLLTRVNPYTGQAPIHDEALGLVILANENGMEFETVVQERPGKPHYPESMVRPFNEWLLTRYETTNALRQAWDDLAPFENLEAGTILLPDNRYQDGLRIRDLQAFFVETEQASLQKMTETLRDLGYPGLISTYNNWATVQTALTRSKLQSVTMNTYHDWVNGYQAGASIKDQSSIADAAAYIRYAAAARWLDKPFAISEYDHLFWNRHRYEAGLLMPAYAALQDWDALCRHAHGPIVLRYGEPFAHKRAMLPYAIALDPVARAGETLAALLFRRGDVAPAANTIPFTMRGIEDLGGDMQEAEFPELTELALVSRIGLRDSGGLRLTKAINQPRDRSDRDTLLAELRDSGLLARTSRTDPSQGIFESDTGQLLLEARQARFQVISPKTEGAAFASLEQPVVLQSVRLNQADGSGSLAVSVIDNAPSLAESRRMLIVYATDARNTGMRFRGPDETVIEDFGTLPVLVRKGSASLSLPGRSGQWRLSPIGLDGKVYPPIQKGNGPVDLPLSNDLPSGPTTFFLLEID